MTNEKFTYLPGVSKMTPGVVVEAAVVVVMFEIFDGMAAILWLAL